MRSNRFLLCMLACLLCAVPPIGAEALGLGLIRHRNKKEPTPPAQFMHPSQAPAFSVSVDGLSFAAPGALYQGLRYTFVSLDFLDESHLLFTFRVPGLMRREGSDAGNDQRQIRTQVLALPSGSMQTEDLWTLHGHERYLWMLENGHYLVLDDDNLFQGDASLKLKPLLHFPGPLSWLEMDPSQKYLVTNSREPKQAAAKTGDAEGPATAQALITSDSPPVTGDPPIVLRIIERATGKVMLVSRTRSTVHLPINDDGYLEALRGREHEWILNFNYFNGGSRIVGRISSNCAPLLDFITPQIFVATGCDSEDGRVYLGLTLEGRKLWEISSSSTQVWPRLTPSPAGTRIALETLVVSHAVNTIEPLSFEEVKGQLIQVYDAASGKLLLAAPADPILDGGGNVAISPSGRRVAVLNQGSIQVYELAEPQAPTRISTRVSGK